MMGIANVFTIGGPVGVGTRAGMAVIGHREHMTTQNGTKLRDGTFGISLSLQMATN